MGRLDWRLKQGGTANALSPLWREGIFVGQRQVAKNHKEGFMPVWRMAFKEARYE